MRLPAFFDRVPRVALHDGLAELLGAADGGILEFGYADAVRLAGHSCPTVAAAYWMTLRALAELYPDALPERGGVRVDFRDDVHSGANGVVAAVVQLITGAAGDAGFKGLFGRHARAGLQRFSPDLPLALRFTRLDTGQAVDVEADLSLLPPDPALMRVLQRCAGGDDAQALAELGPLWQRRVEHLLLELAHDEGVFVVRRVERRPSRAAPPPAEERRTVA